jgi:hypothetical protein
VEVLKFLNENKVDITPRAGGSSVTKSIEPEMGGVIVDCSDMNGIIEVNETDMYVTAKAGTSLDWMEKQLNEMGYTAANISCTTNDKDPVKRIKKGNIELDHAVLAVVDKGTKFLFDATNGHFIATPVNFDFSEIESIHVAQYVTQQKKKYLIVCPIISPLNINKEKQWEIINTTKLCTMSAYEVDYLRDKIQKVINGNSFRQFAFHQTHEPQRKRIEELYKELQPYSDEEIKTHIVRK